jgi:hypothetical protein
MAISDSQKVDLLYKKVGFGVSKTDTSTYKSPSNEANASPILTRGDSIWQQSIQLPATIPSGNTSVALIYSDALTTTIECAPDTTSHPVGGVYPTWLTNLQDWVPPSFGSTYQVKVYVANPGVTNAQTSGTQLFADGSGNADSWYFDYQAGILNFLDTNIPTPLTSGKHIYIVGARYIGQKGLTSFPNGITIGNISINGNTVSGNTDLTLSGNVTVAATTNATSNYNGALHVAGGASISSDLWVGGSVYTNAIISENISILSVADPLLYLTANLPYPYNYDIGFYSHFVGGSGNIYQHTGIVRNYNDNNWYFFSNATEPGGGLVDLANTNLVLDTIKSGGLILANTTVSNSYTTGALVIAGGAGINGNIYLTGNIVTSSNGYFTIPTGTSSQRPNVAQTGMIRYNSTISSFEGFGAGGAWSSLGGVKSVDGHAYITAESYAGAGDDVLSFYAGDTGVSTQVMWASNANVSVISNTNSTSPATGAFQVVGGVGILGNLNVNANVTANNITSNNVFSTTFLGNVSTDYIKPYNTTVTVFNSNTAVGMPVGNTSARPSPVPGYVRYNTDTSSIEYYNGSMWTSVTNTVVDQVIYADGINNTFALNQPASATGILVSINGVLQLPAQSYTIDSSNNIVFGQIPTDSDVIDIRFLGPLIMASDTVASDLTVTGNLTIGGVLKAPQATKLSNSPGTVGQICWDANYIYVCTATNTWKRSQLTGGY